MRLSLKRFIVFLYLVVCAFLSLLNYRYSALYSGEDAQIQQHNKTVDESDANLHKTSEATTTIASSLFSELRQLIGIKASLALWPEDSKSTDRILEQLSYTPKFNASRQLIIYLPHGLGAWNVRDRDSEFRACRINNCLVTDKNGGTYDAVVHRNNIVHTVERQSSDQVWIFYSLESPENTGGLFSREGSTFINWTATYRYDSDIVTPYEKFSLYSDSDSTSVAPIIMTQDYAKKKTKKVAWFVSNCFTNNDRLNYARNLSQYIDVDIYGGCGTFKCSRLDPNCFGLLKNDYKFYLAFENSNCRDYITEKFFYNALQHDIVPVAMGARKSEYQRIAPPHSFIHVDDFASPEDLAAYLHKLDADDKLYNEYFRWKTMGKFVDTKFWCRLCTMLNAPKRKSYADLEKWWKNPNDCSRKKWPAT